MPFNSCFGPCHRVCFLHILLGKFYRIDHANIEYQPVIAWIAISCGKRIRDFQWLWAEVDTQNRITIFDADTLISWQDITLDGNITGRNIAKKGFSSKYDQAEAIVFSAFPPENSKCTASLFCLYKL